METKNIEFALPKDTNKDFNDGKVMFTSRDSDDDEYGEGAQHKSVSVKVENDFFITLDFYDQDEIHTKLKSLVGKKIKIKIDIEE